MALGRAALVTGATRSRGIAAAIAQALARDGWGVATTGWRPFDATEPWGSRAEEAEALISVLRGLGVAAGYHEDDLGDPAAPARILDAAERVVGPLAALVNVHTHSGLGGLLDTTPEDFDRHMAVNARGTLLLSAEFVRRFRGEPPTEGSDGTWACCARRRGHAEPRDRRRHRAGPA